MQCSRCDKQAIISTPALLCEECTIDASLAMLAACRLSNASISALIQSGFDVPIRTDRHFTATDIANELGVSAQKIGRLANANELKTDQYGEWRLSQAANSSKQIESFFYNDQGRRRIIDLMR